jgi:hypothetical protein
MAALSKCFKWLAKVSSLDGALSTITEAVQELVHAQRVAVFLVDHAREVLWTSFVHPVTGHARQIRTRQRDGCIGRCAATKQQLSISFPQEGGGGEGGGGGVRDDAALQQLAAAVSGRCVSVWVTEVEEGEQRQVASLAARGN